MSWRIEQGDCIERLRAMPDASIDAVVTDPPYGIGFMGHEWDQPGEHGPVKRNGTPAPFASGRAAEGPHVAGGVSALERQIARSSRRATQRAPSSGAGHARARAAAAAGEPIPPDAMQAGRYDLSPTANRRFQAWCEEWATEVLRVLKPGGHLLVFGSTRTYHRLAAGVEDAGFEIRDTIAWMFGSGFPKSLDVAKALDLQAATLGRRWLAAPYGAPLADARRDALELDMPDLAEAIDDTAGWGTALKPGYEPIVVARKPLVGTVATNVLEHGTGAVNIDGCRIDHGEGLGRVQAARPLFRVATPGETVPEFDPAGRWPANVLLDVDAAAELDEQTGELLSGANPTRRGADKFRSVYGDFAGGEEIPARGADRGGASRFFYCAKASTAERNAGLDGLPLQPKPTWSSGQANAGAFQSDGTAAAARNVHPTVKPIDVMRWLVRLVTPPGGTVLDLFNGSGTTGCAAVLEGFDYIGIERNPAYVAIAEARIAWWAAQPAAIDVDDALAAEARRRKLTAGGQAALDLFSTSQPDEIPMRPTRPIRSTPIVLEEPPVGEHREGHCWWCGAELVDREKAIRYGRTHCYEDREGRDCVGARRRSVVWSARKAVMQMARRAGRPLACVDCGVVVAELNARGVWVDTPGAPKWEADHEIPLEQGGSHTIGNFRCRCVPCHQDKTARESGHRAAQRRSGGTAALTTEEAA